jgi:hypothetical protein
LQLRSGEELLVGPCLVAAATHVVAIVVVVVVVADDVFD